MNNLKSSNFNKWQYKNILAIDFGTQFSGLATFCPGRDPYPTPYGRLHSHDLYLLIGEIIKIVHDESIELAVLGIPYLLDGKETEMTRRIKNFGHKLAHKIAPIPLNYQDETLSSYAAEERMKSSPQYNFKSDLKKIDAVAATIILEDFMEK